MSFSEMARDQKRDLFTPDLKSVVDHPPIANTSFLTEPVFLAEVEESVWSDVESAGRFSFGVPPRREVVSTYHEGSELTI